ncbi:hypothetical protein REPUB_Repub02eG0056500 [Reevesia pubescens]
MEVARHLHLLKELVHRTLNELSENYGPIMHLQFGTRKVLIVFSASAAKECFTKNDIIFANRPQLLADKHLNYNNATIGLAPYGDYWRNLRRLTTLEKHRRMREDSTDHFFGTSDTSNKDRKATLIDVILALQQTDSEFYTDETIK